MTGFFNPQGFLTAMRQVSNNNRKHLFLHSCLISKRDMNTKRTCPQPEIDVL